MSRKITFLTLCLWLTAATFTVFAQQKSNTTYIFRFVSQEDMFYVPWSGNGKELSRLLECVKNNKTDILSGRVSVLVDAYCNSLGSDAENLAMAKRRSNRVKSELITRQGLNEDCFTTHNHATEGDFVIVRLTIPAKGIAVTDSEAEARRKAEAERLEAEKRAEQQNTVTDTPSKTKAADNYQFALRANLLRWVTLTPDLGIEWRVSPSMGILVNGSWTSWTWNDNDHRYALWEVMPEMRWYLGAQKAWYLGAMSKIGKFNYKLSGTGKQGSLIGGGITGGYQLQLSKALSMDFGLALGYLHVDYETYVVTNTVRVYTGEGTQNWWGPINAGVSLVWKL